MLFDNSSRFNDAEHLHIDVVMCIVKRIDFKLAVFARTGTGAAEVSQKWGSTKERDPKGRTSMARRAEAGSGVLRDGQLAPLHQLRGLGSGVSFPLGVWAKLRPKSISIFLTQPSIYLWSNSIWREKIMSSIACLRTLNSEKARASVSHRLWTGSDIRPSRRRTPTSTSKISCFNVVAGAFPPSMTDRFRLPPSASGISGTICLEHVTSVSQL